MRKIFVFVFLALAVSAAMAKPVGPVAARQAAVSFLARQKGSAPGGVVDLTQQAGIAGLYLFAGRDGGFVVVSSDDRVPPVLGYSTDAPLSLPLPAAARYWLKGYAAQIEDARRAGVEPSQEVRRQWHTLLEETGGEPLFATNVAPLLSTAWNQDDPYNALCPYDSEGGFRCATGCVATAMAQVMRYHNHPSVGTGQASYGHSRYGLLSADFSSTAYAWHNMPAQLTSASSAAERTAVATLMYHCGVSVSMYYGSSSAAMLNHPGGSIYTSTAERALRTYFRYDKGIYSMYRSHVSDQQWMALLDAELAASRPVLYSGSDDNTGHAFVCDGSNDAGYYHFNWGWGGSSDGFFLVDALAPGWQGEGGGTHFNDGQSVVMNIKPESSSGGLFTVRGLAADSQQGSVAGSGQYRYGDTAALAVEATALYRFSHWDDGSTSNPMAIVVGRDQSHTAFFERVDGDTLHYDNGSWDNAYSYAYWGIKLLPEMLAGKAALEAVQAALEAGNYELTVYNGASIGASTRVYNTVFSVADFSWHTIDIPGGLPVDNSQPVFITLHSDEGGWPAQVSGYTGNDNGGYTSFDGVRWTPYPVAYMVRGIFSSYAAGIAETGPDEVHLYPNPTAGRLVVDGVGRQAKVSVYDLSGRRLMESEGGELDLSCLPSGPYMVRVSSAGQVKAVLRVVKQ